MSLIFMNTSFGNVLMQGYDLDGVTEAEDYRKRSKVCGFYHKSYLFLFGGSFWGCWIFVLRDLQDNIVVIRVYRQHARGWYTIHVLRDKEPT